MHNSCLVNAHIFKAGQADHLSLMNGEIRRLRELNALTRKDLSELSDVDQATLYLREHGRTARARPSTIRRLASALGVEPSVLMSTQTRLDL